MKLAGILVLAASALAAPLAARAGNFSASFTAVSLGSTQQILQFSAFTVRNSNVYLCGSNRGAATNLGPPCTGDLNVTAFGAAYGDNTAVFLDTVTRGSQLLFIRLDGTIGYTAPNATTLPDGAVTNAFSVSGPEHYGESGSFNPTSGPWLTCLTADGTHQLYADTAGFTAPDGNPKNCYSFVGKTNPWYGDSYDQYD